MLTPPGFPQFFKRLEQCVLPDVLERERSAGSVYSFTFGENYNSGVLRVWRAVQNDETSKVVPVVKDWYFHHTLWFKHNEPGTDTKCRFSAFVEFLDDYREPVVVAKADNAFFELPVFLGKSDFSINIHQVSPDTSLSLSHVTVAQLPQQNLLF